MLKQASIADLVSGALSRQMGHIVVCMRFYPRYLKKDQRDEYLHVLAPDEKLFDDFKTMQKKLADHNVAFRLVKYEERFSLSREAIDELKRLAELSQTQDVYLLCQCAPGERCHRDLLLIFARRRFHIEVEKSRLAYPIFEKILETKKDL